MGNSLITEFRHPLNPMSYAIYEEVGFNFIQDKGLWGKWRFVPIKKFVGFDEKAFKKDLREGAEVLASLGIKIENLTTEGFTLSGKITL